MKHTLLLFRMALCILACGIHALPAVGETFTLDGDTTPRNWSNLNLWTIPNPDPGSPEPIHPGRAPGLAGDTVDFTGGGSLRTLSLDVDALTLENLQAKAHWALQPVSTTTLLISGESARFTLGGASTNILSLGSGLTMRVEGGQIGIGNNLIITRARDATLTIQSGAAARFGTAAKRSEWIQGGQGASRDEALHASVVAQAGSTTSFHLSSLTMGTASVALPGQGSSSATLDLSASTVEAFDVSGNVSIGQGHAGSYGYLLLPRLEAKIGGDLTLGSGLAASTAGRITLNGTHLEVGGDVILDVSGRMIVTITGDAPAGLSLSDTSSLSIAAKGTHSGDASAGLHLIFSQNPTLSGSAPLYGLAWEGDKSGQIQSLLDDFSITYENQMTGFAPSLFYDANANVTYFAATAIPEPSCLLLLPIGWVVARFWRRKTGPGIAQPSSRRRASEGRRAFSILELSVAVAVVAVLASLLVPVFARSRAISLQAACASNLRQVYVALQCFLTENSQRFPPNRANSAYQTERNPAGVHHQEYLQPYLPGFIFPSRTAQEAGPFWCPADGSRRDYLPMHSYGINILHGLDDAVRYTSIAQPNQSVYLIDAMRGTRSTCRLNNKAWPFKLGESGRQPPQGGDAAPHVDLRHQGKANALFLDGHIEAFPLDAFIGKSPSRMNW
ncbi:MAG TPA: prepilin-type N-terminal cleavage/methylation domain-containing protein [Chthoniobacteraceae bacterium]|nr:prepilin-type N-terminal cleavage/methylation domain-containing protein [Chthoniobacteraceae bacterium]